MPDNETSRKVSIDYTLAAAQAFEQSFSPTTDGEKTFRFVYLSGAGAEKDQTKSLWAMQDYRRIRVCISLADPFNYVEPKLTLNAQGEVENKLIAYAKDHESRFESYIMRPGMVLSKEMTIRSLVFGLGPSVKVDALAQVMIDLALQGNERQVLENNNICEHQSQ